MSRLRRDIDRIDDVLGGYYNGDGRSAMVLISEGNNVRTLKCGDASRVLAVAVRALADLMNDMTDGDPENLAEMLDAVERLLEVHAGNIRQERELDRQPPTWSAEITVPEDVRRMILGEEDDDGDD